MTEIKEPTRRSRTTQELDMLFQNLRDPDKTFEQRQSDLDKLGQGGLSQAYIHQDVLISPWTLARQHGLTISGKDIPKAVDFLRKQGVAVGHIALKKYIKGKSVCENVFFLAIADSEKAAQALTSFINLTSTSSLAPESPIDLVRS